MAAANLVQGASNAARIWNFFASKGLSAAACAGILGSWQQESDFEPTAVNPSSGAYGLAQWLGSRYNALQAYCSQNGLDFTSLSGQLAFAWYEMTGGDSEWYGAVQNAGGLQAWSNMGVAQAAAFFYNWYEVGGASQVGNRYVYAQNWYSVYQSGAPFVDPSGVGLGSAGSFNMPATPANPASTSPSITFPPSNFSVVANSQRTGNVLYGRRYRVVVNDSSGFPALDVSNLRFSFDIQYVLNQQPPFSTITVYNLDPVVEAILLEYGNKVVLEAGYEGTQYGVIFAGDVVEPRRMKQDNVTELLTLNCLQADRVANQAFATFSVARGESALSLVQNLASKASVSSGLGQISPSLSNLKLPRGKTVFGLTRKYLRQIAQGNGLALHFADGNINMLGPADPPNGDVIELNPQTGLIGVPTQTGLGVQFTCLLNPAITIGAMVHIDNQYIAAQTFTIGQYPRPLDSAGLYRVMSVEHIGDTRGSTWQTKCQTVSQAGGIPGMVSASTGLPYSG